MKIEQLIVQHLYNSKKVSLQNLGTFFLSPDVVISTDSDKESALPQNAISFEYNTRAPEDESLIVFIVEQTRKIRPLATSDLESYTILGREYLNIGKPFHIEGLGTLQKTQTGDVVFEQGATINPRLEAIPAILREKNDEEISFSTVNKKTKSKSTGMLLLSLIFIALVAAAVYYILQKKDATPAEQIIAAVDSSAVVKDTVAQIVPADTLSRRLPGDTSVFKVVIKSYPTEAMASRIKQQYISYGHNVLMYAQDSAKFVLAIPFNSALSDTTRAKDSLQRIFSGSPYIDQL